MKRPKILVWFADSFLFVPVVRVSKDVTVHRFFGFRRTFCYFSVFGFRFSGWAAPQKIISSVNQ